MNALAQKIARLIRSDGPVSIATFMTMALHDPQHGFYATRESIGAEGAFTTAPEISQIFGELVGLWCVQAWCDQGRPARPRLVELGPGRGTLMADALRAMRVMPAFLENLDITLVEASPRLAAMQRERLDAWKGAISWTRQWSDVAADRPLFVLANEFLDALPIRQFVQTERGWCERMVGLDASEELAFVLAPAPVPLPAAERGAPAPGAVYEMAPSAQALVEDVSRIIAKQSGAALFVDYGYGAEAGFGETLQAVNHHRASDVLGAPGEDDLSAHVDFTSLARGFAPGARPYGPIAQAEFLRNLGIVARAEQLIARNPGAEIAAGVERLLSPAAMGTLFKAFAIAPADAPPPPGFQ